MTYRDLYVQGKTEIYAAWQDLEDALRRACECEEQGDLPALSQALDFAAARALLLGEAAEAAVERMRKEES